MLGKRVRANYRYGEYYGSLQSFTKELNKAEEFNGWELVGFELDRSQSVNRILSVFRKVDEKN